MNTEHVTIRIRPFLVLLPLTFLILIALNVHGANDPPPNGGHVEGDWTVTDVRTYTSCTITLHGNLIIQGSLTFNDVELYIESDDQDLFSINITGTFNVYDLDADRETSGDASIIAPDDLRYYFDMNIATTATVDMRNSIMRRYDDISVLSSNVEFIDNDFTHLLNSGFDVAGCSPTFRGNNVSHNQMSGNAFVFYAANGLVFEDNRIDHPWFHVITDACEGMTFRNNTFLRGDRGLVLHETTATIEDNYFEHNGKTVVVEEGTAIVRRNTFFQNGAALATDEFTTNDVEAYDNHIEECGEAFLLPGPGSESTARIHDNMIINCWGAVGLFAGLTARIYDNHIEGCDVVLYTDGSESEFYGNTIINSSYVIYSRHSAVTEVSNNLIANNLFVAAITEGSELSLENNVIRFNLMGIQTYERNSGGAHVTMSGNDMYDNPLFALWNRDPSARIDADNNYWGGVPNEDGDRIIGPNIDHDPHSNSPNDPTTPANPFTPHIVTDTESYEGSLKATGPWIVRDGGDLTLSGIDLDLQGFFLGVKNGGSLEADGMIHNGTTLALSSDPITLTDLNLTEMGINILTFLGSPDLENLTLGPRSGVISWEFPRCQIWSALSDLKVENTVFKTDNETVHLYLDSSNTSVTDTTFHTGNGVEVYSGSISIENCTFTANATSLTGDGCLFSLNSSAVDGLTMVLTGTNSTFHLSSISNTSMSLEHSNGTIELLKLKNATIDLRYSTFGIDSNEADSTDIDLARVDLAFRNNSLSNGSGLELVEIRGIIANNSFRDSDTAVLVRSGSAHINYNNFNDNDVAIQNNGETEINAVFNYYGSTDGPGGDGPGSGDEIHGEIRHDPWSTAPITSEGPLLNFAPIATLDGNYSMVKNSYLFSGWAWDPDGDIITVEVRITGPGYDSGWNAPLEFEMFPGWIRWYYLWDAHQLDAGTYRPTVRVDDGLAASLDSDTWTVDIVPGAYTRHSPIQIRSDADFLRPTSGVTGGSGSEGDPYIISGWEISPSPDGSTPAIDIQNVQSYVVIEDCLFTFGVEDSLYIELNEAPNVDTVRNCTFNTSDGGGIFAQNDGGDIIAMNVSRNLFIELDQVGVRLINYSLIAQHNHIIGDVWTGGPMLVTSYVDSDDSVVKDNVCYRADTGFLFQETDAEIHDNLFLGCAAGGVTETILSNLYIHHNLIVGCGFGGIYNGEVPRIENNTFIDNQKISHYNGQNQGYSAIFRNNTFIDNVEGMTNSFGGFSDARYNYWGSADGPSGDGSGSGDPVDDLTDYDPWHTDGPIGPDHPPRLMFISPENGTSAMDEIELIWYALDLDGDEMQISLYYAPEDDPSDTTHLADLDDSFRYEWDVSSVSDGRYRIVANVTAGNMSYIGLSGVIIVDHNRPPVIDVIEPDGSDDIAHDVFVISWDASDPDDNPLSFSIHHSSDRNDTILIVDGLMNVSSYDWDVSAMDEGDFWIYLEAYDGSVSTGAWSDGTVMVDLPPKVKVLTPGAGGAEADEDFSVEWTSQRASNDARVDLWYDDDTDTGSGLISIAKDLAPNGSYLWSLADVEEGTYYVYAFISENGLNGSDHSDGTLEVSHSGGGPGNHRPWVAVIEPDGDNDVANEEFTITWTSGDEDGDTVSIELYHDNDTNPANGFLDDDPIWSGPADKGSFDWDTSDVIEGDMYIYASVDDGNGSTNSAYSDGPVTITHPAPGENEPPEIGIDSPTDGSTVNDIVTLAGWASDADGNDDLKRIRVRIGTGPWQTAQGTTEWEWSWDTLQTENGEVKVTVKAEDTDGATSMANLTVTVDNPDPAPPWITIGWPANGSVVSGTINITGTAGGGLDIDVIGVTYDAYNIDVFGTDSWYAVWDTSVILYDNVTLTVTVEDEDGTTNTASISVTVDNRPGEVNDPPTIEFTDGPKSVRAGRVAEFELEVGDPDGIDDLAAVRAELRDDGGDVVLEVPSRDISWDDDEVVVEVDTKDLEGTYRLFVYVVDLGGEEDSDSFSFDVLVKKSGDDDEEFPTWLVLVGLMMLLIPLIIVAARKRRSANTYQALAPIPQEPPPPLGQEDVHEVDAVEIIE